MISRRTLLTGALVTGAATALPTSLAHADEAPVDGSTLPKFAAACLTAAVVAMAVHNGHAYVVSRGIVPPRLTEIDLTTRQVIRTVELPVGEGGWGITVAAGKIYVGLYPVADVYCFDPAGGGLTRVGSLAGAGGFVWDMVTAPDGQIFAVSYPNGAIWQTDPATNTLTRIGAPVTGALYGRYVGAAGTTVYAGIYTPSKLIAYDRVGGGFRDLTPEAIRGQKFGPFAATADRLFAGSDGSLTSMALDGSDVRIVPLPAGETSIDAITVSADRTAYMTTRGSGTVWACGPDDTTLAAVATPAPADEHRRLELLDSSTLLGSTGSGVLWWLDVTTGEFELLDLIDAGFTPPRTSRNRSSSGTHTCTSAATGSSPSTRSAPVPRAASESQARPRLSPGSMTSCTPPSTRAPKWFASIRAPRRSTASARSATTSSGRGRRRTTTRPSSSRSPPRPGPASSPAH